MKHSAITFSLVFSLLTILLAGGIAAQTARPKKDIPSLAKAANGAIVTIVMANGDKPIAQGTGFLVSADGVIVTNYHVIAEGNSAVVKFPDGTAFPIDGILAADKVRDLAIVKIHGRTFRTLALGDSDDIQVGEDVVAIGNPLSLESTVSNGIISGVRTSKEQGGKFLQTTAPISPGSSGGPLFNMRGEVVGINSLYLEGGENLNFAIPINDAKQLLLAKSSKIQALPNETEPIKAQTPDGANLLNWISGHFEIVKDVDSSRNYSLSFKGCQATLHLNSLLWVDYKGALPHYLESEMTWGPFDLENLRPDGISFPDSNATTTSLRILVVNAIPVKSTRGDGTSTEMMGWINIFFQTKDMAERQQKAWRDAIILCGGKNTQEHLY